MPAILNLCRKGGPTFLCAFLILPFLTPSPVSNSFQLSAVDTIGRRSDTIYQKELKRWQMHRSNVQAKIINLQRKEAVYETKTRKGPSDSLRHVQDIITMKERIRRLQEIIYRLDSLESDSLVYVVKKISRKESSLGTIYNPRTKEVEFRIVNKTQYFVHEVTHGLQFINGGIVFDIHTGLSVGDDIEDELEAYKNQFSYRITSLANFESSVGNPFEHIDSAWLVRLKDADSTRLYDTVINGRYNVIGLKPVFVDSDISILKEAYPSIRDWHEMPHPLMDKTNFIFRIRHN